MQHPPVKVAAGKGTGGVQIADGGDARQAWTVLRMTAATMRTAIAGLCWTSVATAVPRGYVENHWQRHGHMAGQVLVPDAMVLCLRLYTMGHDRHRGCHRLACHRCSLVEAALQAPRLFAGANGAVLLVDSVCVGILCTDRTILKVSLQHGPSERHLQQNTRLTEQPGTESHASMDSSKHTNWQRVRAVGV